MNPENIYSSRFVQEEDKLQRYRRTTDFLGDAGTYPAYHRLDSAATGPTCVVDGRELVMLCSSNHLGLATHPMVLAGARESLDVHGIGPGGSQMLGGNLGLIEDLDRSVARFLDTEDAITFPTSYMASLSIFPALLDPLVGPLPCRRGRGTVLCDQANYRALLDGAKRTSANRVIFRHNDLEDLERRLANADRGGPRVVAVEGVYTLYGEMAPLAEIGELCRRYEAIFCVDDAQAIGVLGPRGGGTLQHLGLEGKAEVVIGSFGNALGGLGGFLAGRRDIIEYLRVTARANAFASAMPAVMAGAMLRAIDVAREGEFLRRRVRRNNEALRLGLEAIGFQVVGDGTLPVTLVALGEEKAAIDFQKRLCEAGVLVSTLCWPSAPKGLARIRVTPMATHGDSHLATALHAFSRVGRELNLVA